jgi:cell division protein FtsL
MPRAATARATEARAQPATSRPAPSRRDPARSAPARHAAPPRTTAPARRVSGRVHQRTAGRPAALPRGARVLDALLTGRLWIGLIGVLLAGIVFFNVDLLQMNRDITQMADKATRLKRQNDRLRHDYARLASSERIQEAAATLGLVYPAAGEVRYLRSKPRRDAHNASNRITEPTGTATPAPIAPVEPAITTTPSTTTTLPPE